MLGNANTARLALVAAGAALAATGLMHLLLLFIPRPWQFFTWIMSLVTLAALLAPFATDAEIATKVATAAIFLAIGVAIGSAGLRRRLQRRPPRRGGTATGRMMPRDGSAVVDGGTRL